MIAETERVGEIAVKVKGAARVFESHHIDYCCGGRRTLREACNRASVALDAVIAELDALEPAAPETWDSPVLLVAHIVDVHHANARAAMAHVGPLAKKVAHAHGAAHPELLRVVELFEELSDELAPHLRAEEGTLFPAILQMLRPGCTPERRRALRVSVEVMQHDHDHVGRLLALLRETTSDYALPEDACTSYRVLYDELRAFEADLHEHIHLENNVLLPRVLSEPA